jgi:hypothetical protein
MIQQYPEVKGDRIHPVQCVAGCPTHTQEPRLLVTLIGVPVQPAGSTVGLKYQYHAHVKEKRAFGLFQCNFG